MEGIFDVDMEESYYEQHKDVLGLSFDELVRLRKFEHWNMSHESTTFFGRSFGMSSPYWFLQSLEEIFVHEVYRFDTTNEQPLIIDCGANWGLSVIYFKNRFPCAIIHAYEADDVIYAMAKDNLATWQYKDVNLHNQAIWDSNGKLKFSSEGGVGGAVSGLQPNPPVNDYNDAPEGSWVGNYNTYYGVHKTTEKEVAAVRLKDILKRHERIDFLKIDIEGAEHKVIMDCAKELRRVDKMFIEYHSSPAKPQVLHEILKVISKNGFRYYIKEAANNYAHPFTRDKELLYDLQLNIFCFR